MYSGDCIEPTDGEEADGEEVELVEADNVLPDASPPLSRRRLRLQVGEWYVTLAMVGALVGLFAAGILVALNQAFPDGTSGRLNAGWLTGLAIGIIVGASALGALMAGAAQLAAWGWRRATAGERPHSAPLSEENVPDRGECPRSPLSPGGRGLG